MGFTKLPRSYNVLSLKGDKQKFLGLKIPMLIVIINDYICIIELLPDL